MAGERAGEAGGGAVTVALPGTVYRGWLLAGGVALSLAFLWAYWPTLIHVATQWFEQPDYSHGMLVVPLAIFFLWVRRAEFPREKVGINVWGGVLLLVAAAMRLGAGFYFLGPLDCWTIPLWIGGIVWLLCGWDCLKWSLPSIVFLWFMLPIPYSAETMLSVPLQALAAKLSTACLVMLGQPALAEGNVIWLEDRHLLVEEACSGMRIFVGIFAISFAFALFSRWSWWQKALVILATLPIAILANVTRVVVTGLLYQLSSSEVAHHFSHDLTGFVMIPFAVMLFWMFLVYLDHLFPEAQQISAIEIRATDRK